MEGWITSWSLNCYWIQVGGSHWGKPHVQETSGEKERLDSVAKQWRKGDLFTKQLVNPKVVWGYI